MNLIRNVALIAHDNLKETMVTWATTHLERLKKFRLCATLTTGTLLSERLGMEIERLASGPQGGDLQIGAKVVDGTIDLIIFFWDPMSPHPHDVDVKALLRIAAVRNVPIACNPASADLMIRSS